MAGAYLEINPQETYGFSSNVLLNNVAQDLYGATVWFTAFSQDDYANGTPFINLSGNSANVLISNGGGSSTNSVVNVTLPSALTANLSQVNVGTWSLVAKTSQGRVYQLDGGRIAVLPPVGISYQ